MHAVTGGLVDRDLAPAAASRARQRDAVAFQDLQRRKLLDEA